MPTAKKKVPTGTFSLTAYARLWAMLTALCRKREIEVPAETLDRAYSGYVSGDVRKVSQAVSDLCDSSGIAKHRILPSWNKLDKEAKRETNRRAFES